MNRQTAFIFGLLLVCCILLIGNNAVYGKSKEEKAIGSALKKVGYKNVCKLTVTTKTNNITQQIYDNSKCVVVTPPTPPVPPTPTPIGNTSKVCLVGDLSGSTIPNKMNSCNLKIGLGDLGYKSDLSWFKSLNFNKCVIGNHDAPEDGSSSIYQEALAYCGDHWSLTTANGTTLIIGLNTNGDVNTQVNFVKSLSLNYKNIIVVTHKNGHVFPNAHHPAEASNLYSQLEKLIPNLYEISGHNHNMASAINGHWFISGAGGKSHYNCGQDSIWTFCDNSNYGYLELSIDNNTGSTIAQFIK